MPNMNLNVSEKTQENIAFIMQHQDIGSKTSAIKQALNFFRRYLEKEDAKTTAYTKKTKQDFAPQRISKSEQDTENGKKMCVLDFEGVICDEFGEENPNGLYCKYDTYEQVTSNKIIKTMNEVNPCERLEGLWNSEVKYRNTSKTEVNIFSKRDDVEFTIMEPKTQE